MAGGDEESDDEEDEDFDFEANAGARRFPIHDCCEFEDEECLRVSRAGHEKTMCHRCAPCMYLLTSSSTRTSANLLCLPIFPLGRKLRLLCNVHANAVTTLHRKNGGLLKSLPPLARVG
jgi:hypothetical protein